LLVSVAGTGLAGGLEAGVALGEEAGDVAAGLAEGRDVLDLLGDDLRPHGVHLGAQIADLDGDLVVGHLANFLGVHRSFLRSGGLVPARCWLLS
jgi:hypothetical protein